MMKDTNIEKKAKILIKELKDEIKDFHISKKNKTQEIKFYNKKYYTYLNTYNELWIQDNYTGSPTACIIEQQLRKPSPKEIRKRIFEWIASGVFASGDEENSILYYK